MEFLITGDWHIRATKPKSRIDDYKTSLFKKLKWILAHGYVILQPGDFFDSPVISYGLTLETMRLFENREFLTYTVFGQHDLRYHASEYCIG
jgi:DNA repair exonuclease SbcCD nuclease subunit